MADLQEIFSRLKASSQQSQASAADAGAGGYPSFQPQILQRAVSSSQGEPRSIWAQQDPSQMVSQSVRGVSHSGYRRPEVSSPITSPPTRTPEPVHTSRVISPVAGSQVGAPAGGPDGGDDRRNQLLNLLKFNTNPGTARGTTVEKPSIEKKEIPAQLTGLGTAAANGKPNDAANGPPKETQDFLLNLLKGSAGTAQGNPLPLSTAHVERNGPVSPPLQQLFSPRQPSERIQPTSQQQPTPSAASKFNYTNPFDALHTSSPLNQGLPEGQPPVYEQQKESVADALEGIAQQASDDAKKALDRATAASAKEQKPEKDEGAKPEQKSSKNESEQESSWETQEDEEAAREQNAHVPVYNFPMLPFRTVSLQLPEPGSRTFAPENIMPIAKHKKAFSQDDRSLAAASVSYIVYAQPGTSNTTGKKEPNFGFRVLRQDTGTHQQIFNRIMHRVVDVRISTGVLDGDDDAALATTDNGFVFWARLPDSEVDFDGLGDKDFFVMPPLDTGGENNPSAGAVKTRARCANKTAKFFALSRGKSVFLVSPAIARDYVKPGQGPEQRIDTQRYFQDHSLVIKAGKSVKDFTFSPDDSCIVTLDKGGKAKFWDVASLANRIANKSSSVAHSPVEVSECLHMIDASIIGSGESGEKTSVSSVMLLDKGRPFEKDIALRYLLVGLKQNHVLQLWDLGLGKCVQALHFPPAPEDGVDGMLSLSYNPKAGIIAIGSPARNSISFVHLSAPKYNLPSTGADAARLGSGITFVTALGLGSVFSAFFLPAPFDMDAVAVETSLLPF